MQFFDGYSYNKEDSFQVLALQSELGSYIMATSCTTLLCS